MKFQSLQFDMSTLLRGCMIVCIHFLPHNTNKNNLSLFILAYLYSVMVPTLKRYFPANAEDFLSYFLKKTL